METESLVSPEQAAEFLKVGRATVISWARRGIIPAVPLSGGRGSRKRWRFRLSALAQHLGESGVHSSRHPRA